MTAVEADPKPLKLSVSSLQGARVGFVELDRDIYALPTRRDLLHRYVRWQMAKRRGGNHASQGRADVARSGKKLGPQKGSGSARHGAASAPQFRGGGKAFGPVVRDHEIALPKKVRSRALRHAISTKVTDEELVILDELAVETHKTKNLKAILRTLGLESALIVTGDVVDRNFKLASQNIENVDLISYDGLNVRDILTHRNLVLSLEAVEKLRERFRSRPRRKAVARLYWPNFRHPTRDVNARKEELVQAWTILSESESDERREAMVTVGSGGADEGGVEESKARLLPILASDDASEARMAALTLCTIAFPAHYGRRQAARRGAARRRLTQREIETVRRDLSRLLREERMEYVAYADLSVRESDEGRRVTVRARLSRYLPFDLGGEPAQVDVPDWLSKSDQFFVSLSGEGIKSDTVTKNVLTKSDGDFAAMQIECTLRDDSDSPLFLDFFSANRWLQRKELTVFKPF